MLFIRAGDMRWKKMNLMAHIGAVAQNLRIIYAVIALLFAIASTVYWMRFVIFYYDPEKHSDAVFGIITSACTINIVAAFISITKGLFPILSKNE
ncbi:hypothetical protein HAINFHK1212_0974 [Haemophilus influenzae HK1212]|uniref:Uncharacterized protein n=1 Tax=Haemophilus influenzae HK1212 TaxID=456482 RepID=A0A7G2JYR1_HAEIF|nr:hypothetical protein HAINFHK1212_0974 [Haemophilus influenzae HK1212]